jgi:hypothetical protein
MDLFYHASRDIELPRSSRRAAAERAVRACEACGNLLEQGEPSEGGTVGLAFCAACRDRLDRSAIQIHFCDGCGVSIPLRAVEEGSALTVDGRLLCAKCRLPAPREVNRFLVIAAAVLAALLAGALLAWI